VALMVSRSNAKLIVVNELPLAVADDRAPEGRGLGGMRQRVELLGGVIDVGPVDNEWSVCADIPLADSDVAKGPRGCVF
jgi:hypothetical protein